MPNHEFCISKCLNPTKLCITYQLSSSQNGNHMQNFRPIGPYLTNLEPMLCYFSDSTKIQIQWTLVESVIFSPGNFGFWERFIKLIHKTALPYNDGHNKIY